MRSFIMFRANVSTFAFSIALATPTKPSQQISGTLEHLGIVKETALITLPLSKANKLNTLFELVLSPLSSKYERSASSTAAIAFVAFLRCVAPNWIEQVGDARLRD